MFEEKPYTSPGLGQLAGSCVGIDIEMVDRVGNFIIFFYMGVFEFVQKEE